jgi:hypothetical protein
MSGLTYADLGFGLFAATAAQRSIPTVHRREPIMFYIIKITFEPYRYRTNHKAILEYQEIVSNACKSCTLLSILTIPASATKL